MNPQTQPEVNQRTKLALIKKNSILRYDGGTMDGRLTEGDRYQQVQQLYGLSMKLNMIKMPSLAKTRSKTMGASQTAAGSRLRDQYIEVYRDGQIEYL